MQRLLSWLIRIAFVFVLLGASSFVAAQFKMRQLLGTQSPVRQSETTFAWKGVQDLPGKPRAWVFTFLQIRLPGVRQVRIVVSPSGRILSVRPPDLEDRLDAYRQSREP